MLSPEHISAGFPTSFTPINQGSSSFKPAPKLARQRSEELCGSMLHGAADSYNPKRRKTEPATCDVSEHDDFQRGEDESNAMGPNQIPNLLHLGVPPNLKSRKKKVVKRTKSASELFSEAPIKKPRQPRQRKTVVQHKTSSYQGFTTTEDSLKNPVELAQTTLNKLASFKYRPALASYQSQVLFPSANSPFSNPIVGDPQSAMLADDGGEHCLPMTASQTLPLEDEDAQILDVAHFDDAYFDYAADFSIPSPDHDPHRENVPGYLVSADNDCPEYLAKNFVNEASVPILELDMHPETLENHFLPHDHRPLFPDAEDATENAMIQDCPSLEHLNVDPRRELDSQTFDDSNSFNTAVNFGPSPAAPIPVDVVTHHQNETTIEDSEPQHDVGSRATEFSDGGIDDEDLQQLICRNNLSHSGDNRPIVEQASGPNSIQNNGSPDSEDEFAMDEADEEALMQFATLPGTVHETRPPSSSFPFASEGESRDLEIYDRNLQYSDPSVKGVGDANDDSNLSAEIELDQPSTDTIAIEENWSFLNNRNATSSESHRIHNHRASAAQTPLYPSGRTAPSSKIERALSTRAIDSRVSSQLAPCDDSAEYLPLKPFARPEFPAPMRDRSPVIGFSGSLVLRTCFRIGEAFRVAAVSDSATYDILIELFARVTFSSREEGTARQHFQFADLFHDRPPFLNGLFENYKISDLANIESRQLLGDSKPGKMARCLGKIRREYQGKRVFVIENVRGTDWEEIVRTKTIIEDINGKVKPQITGMTFL